MNIIDLRSDTTTHPTPEMRQAMYAAEVGDDGYGEDPTVNRLQDMAAALLNKEASLFTASGTMSNLIAVLSNTSHGDEVLLGSEAHMLWFEVGGASTFGGVVMRALPNDEYGQIDLSAIEKALQANFTHNRQITLFCLENTHTRCGGIIVTPEYIAAAAAIAHEHGVNVYIDGARIFNACVSLGVSPADLTAPVDSVSFCLSKGLGAPAGSLLCGSRELINKARRWRKMLGGSMRQSGILAAAGIVALEKMIDRMADDHENAKRLAYGLAAIDGFTVQLDKVQTNTVSFFSPETIPAIEFRQQLNAKGIRFGHQGENKFRAVTHWMISSADIDTVLASVHKVIQELR